MNFTSLEMSGKSCRKKCHQLNRGLPEEVDLNRHIPLKSSKLMVIFTVKAKKMVFNTSKYTNVDTPWIDNGRSNVESHKEMVSIFICGNKKLKKGPT